MNSNKKKKPKKIAATLTLATSVVLGGLGLLSGSEKDTNNKGNIPENPSTSQEIIIPNDDGKDDPLKDYDYSSKPPKQDKDEDKTPGEEIKTDDDENIKNEEQKPEDSKNNQPTDEKNNTENNEENQYNKHTHYLGTWVSINDTFEENYCPEDGTLMGRRTHEYKNEGYEKISNEDGTHTLKIYRKCQNCNHETVEVIPKVDCTYFGITFDKTYEYETCVNCGYVHTIGKHKLDNGIRKGNEIVYTCENEGCNYTLTRQYNPGHSHGGSGGSSSNTSHSHYYGEWVSLNDELEANYCPEDGTLVGTREHKYKNIASISNPLDDGHHTTINNDECLNCGHIKTTSTINDCTYGSIVFDETYEYLQCSDCGTTKNIGKHVLDNGTINSETNQKIYACTNPGCGYTKTETYNPNPPHIHDYETKDRYTSTSAPDSKSHIHERYKECTAKDSTITISSETENCNWNTLENNGTITYTCDKNCGNTYTETLSHTNHNYGNWEYLSETEEKGYCTYDSCPSTTTRPHQGALTTNTEYTSTDTEHHKRIEKTNCSSCSPKETASFDNELCTFNTFVRETTTGNIYKCACGNEKEYAKDHEHNYGNWEYLSETEEISYCTYPGCTETQKQGHTLSETPTYTKTGTNTNRVHDINYECGTCDYIQTESESCTLTTTDSTETKPIIGSNTAHHTVTTSICGKCDNSYENVLNIENCSFTYDVSSGQDICNKCGRESEHTHTANGEGTKTSLIKTIDTCYETYYICESCNQKVVTSQKGHKFAEQWMSGIWICSQCKGKYPYTPPTIEVIPPSQTGLPDELDPSFNEELESQEPPKDDKTQDETETTPTQTPEEPPETIPTDTGFGDDPKSENGNSNGEKTEATEEDINLTIPDDNSLYNSKDEGKNTPTSTTGEQTNNNEIGNEHTEGVFLNPEQQETQDLLDASNMEKYHIKQESDRVIQDLIAKSDAATQEIIDQSDNEIKDIIEKRNAEVAKIKEQSDVESSSIKEASDKEMAEILKKSDEETKAILERSDQEVQDLIARTNAEVAALLANKEAQMKRIRKL